MLRLIPGTVFRMFGARYSKIILRYPFFVTACLFCLLRVLGANGSLANLASKIPSRTIYRFPLFILCKVSILRFLFFRGILLSCLEKIRPLFERSSVASLRLSRLFRELFRSFFRFSENCLFRNDSSENDILFYRCRCSSLPCLRLVSCVQNNNNNNKQVP